MPGFGQTFGPAMVMAFLGFVLLIAGTTSPWHRLERQEERGPL